MAVTTMRHDAIAVYRPFSDSLVIEIPITKIHTYFGKPLFPDSSDLVVTDDHQAFVIFTDTHRLLLISEFVRDAVLT